MVVIVNTWMSIHTVAGALAVLRRTDRTYLALETIWVDLLQHVQRLLLGGEQFLMVEGLCLVPEVLPSGFFPDHHVGIGLADQVLFMPYQPSRQFIRVERCHGCFLAVGRPRGATTMGDRGAGPVRDAAVPCARYEALRAAI